VPVAPAWVQVNSSLGGSDREMVLVLNESGTGAEPPPPVEPPAPGEGSPIANNDVVAAVIDTATVINVAGNDVDADGTLNLASIEIVQAPTLGTIGLIGAGGLTYIPGPDFAAAISDTFTYVIKDNLGNTSNVASVTVTPVAAQITVGQAQYRTDKSEWRVDGSSNAVSNTASVYLVRQGTTTEVLVGESPVDAVGSWGVRIRGGGPVPANGDTLTVKIGNAVTLSGIALQVRN
jgi:Bacterial Ig domain